MAPKINDENNLTCHTSAANEPNSSVMPEVEICAEPHGFEEMADVAEQITKGAQSLMQEGRDLMHSLGDGLQSSLSRAAAFFAETHAPDTADTPQVPVADDAVPDGSGEAAHAVTVNNPPDEANSDDGTKNADLLALVGDSGFQPIAQDKTVLKFGSQGSLVDKVQTYFDLMGLYEGKLDGTFGPKTRKAVIAFQKEFNTQVENGLLSGPKLQVDGIVGDHTLSAMKTYAQKVVQFKPDAMEGDSA